MQISLQEMIGRPFSLVLQILFGALLFSLTALSLLEYPGNGMIYLLFSLGTNLLLFAGFRRNAIFFDTFIGIFFWLGFWLKLSIRVAFLDGDFHEPIGQFDGSGEAFDRALLVAVCGVSGLLVASFLRELFFKYPKKIAEVSQRGLYSFYDSYRKLIWIAFVSMVIAIGISNAYLGIYQRGRITETVLPFGINGIYKWLLLFGLASVSALIIRFEMEIRRRTWLPALAIGFIETFISNISLLSRGMILNGGALIYGVIASLKTYSVKSSLRFFLIAGILFSLLFGSSVLAVNYMRSYIYTGDALISEKPHKPRKAQLNWIQNMTLALVVDRWVGIEGVMAVSSHSSLGWSFFNKALKEDYNENETSFYDNNLITSAYINTDKTQHHFISLPGIIAFFFYPGSFLFLFICMLTLGLTAAAIEAFVYHLGGQNLILCALLAQVVAFRFASFGYVPKQSYLLFGTILLNILIIYLADKLLTRFKTKSAPAPASNNS